MTFPAAVFIAAARSFCLEFYGMAYDFGMIYDFVWFMTASRILCPEVISSFRGFRGRPWDHACRLPYRRLPSSGWRRSRSRNR